MKSNLFIYIFGSISIMLFCMGLFVDSIYGFTSVFYLCLTLSMISGRAHNEIIERINLMEKKLIIERSCVHND